MRTKVLIALVCVGAYFGFWYVQANYIEKRVKDELAGRKEYFEVHYDAVEKRGFPFSIQLAFVNPKIEVKGLELSFDLNGFLSGRWSLFGALKELEMTGTSHSLIPFTQGDQHYEMHVDGNTVVEIDSIRSLADKGVIRQNKTRVLCKGPTTEEVEFDLVAIQYVVKERSDERLVVQLGVETAGAKSQFTGPERFSNGREFVQVVSSQLAEVNAKQRNVLELVVELPAIEKMKELLNTPLQLLTERIPTVAIDLKKWQTSGSLADATLVSSFRLQEDEQKNVEIHASGDLGMHFFAAHRQALEQGLDKLKAALETKPVAEDLVQYKDLVVNHVDELKALVPQFEKLGAIDASKQLYFKINKSSLNWHLALTKFGLTTELYGVQMNVDAQQRTGDLKLEANLLFTHPKQLFSDAISWHNRLAVVLNILEQDPQKHFKILPEDSAEKVVNFLTLFANKAEGDQLDIPITYKDGATMIGPFTLEQARAHTEAFWNTW